jgi:hypothetical protein
MINISNTPSSQWPRYQLSAARELCDKYNDNGIVDAYVPMIDPQSSTENISAIAASIWGEIQRRGLNTEIHNIVHLDGDPTFIVAMLPFLWGHEFVVFNATKDWDDEFVCFRAYPTPSDRILAIMVSE